MKKAWGRKGKLMKTFKVLGSAAILLFLGACAVNPVTGEKEISIISESTEIQMGQRNFGPYVQQFNALYQNDAIQDYVEKIGTKLSQVSHRANMPFEFVVVNSSIVIRLSFIFWS